MSKPFDTGLDTDFDDTVYPRMKIARMNARTVVYDDSTGQWFMVYIDYDTPGTRNELWLAWGTEDSWNEQMLVSTGGAPLLKTSSADPEQCGIGYDATDDDIHVIWTEDIPSSAQCHVFHARLNNTGGPAQIGNWQQYGANRWQQVDNAGGTGKAFNPSIDVDDSQEEPVVVWQQTNANNKDEIYVNVGDQGNGGFLQANAFCISTNGGNENAHTHDHPCVCVIHEIGQEIYVAYYSSGYAAADAYVECKRLANGNPWGVFNNWLGPQNGNNTGDSVCKKVGLDAIGESMGISYWWDMWEQVFVSCVLDADVYTNWFDGGNVYGWGADTWNSANGTAESFANIVHTHPSVVNTNDFRVFVVDTGDFVQFGDTDEGGSVFNPSDFQPVFLNPLARRWNAEMYGGNVHAFEVVLIAADTTSNIFYIESKTNAKPTVSTISPCGGEGIDEEDGFSLFWNYTDSDGNPQRDYRIQIDEYGEDYSTPVVDQTGVPPDASITHPIPPDTLEAQTHYKWRAKVWDNQYGTEYGYNAESDWSAGTDAGADFWTTLPPELEVTGYIQYPETRWPRITYDLYHNAEKPFSFGTAQYRDGEGGTWYDMTEKSGVGSEGLTGLSTGTPTPDTHYFWWDGETDEPGLYSEEIQVRMKGYVSSKDGDLWSDINIISSIWSGDNYDQYSNNDNIYTVDSDHYQQDNAPTGCYAKVKNNTIGSVWPRSSPLSLYLYAGLGSGQHHVCRVKNINGSQQQCDIEFYMTSWYDTQSNCLLDWFDVYDTEGHFLLRLDSYTSLGRKLSIHRGSPPAEYQTGQTFNFYKSGSPPTDDVYYFKIELRETQFRVTMNKIAGSGPDPFDYTTGWLTYRNANTFSGLDYVLFRPRTHPTTASWADNWLVDDLTFTDIGGLDVSLDTKPPTVSLYSPPDQDEQTPRPTLQWQMAVDDSALWSSGAHLLQLDIVDTFDSTFKREYGWMDDTEQEISLALDRGETYYWRVKARDNFLNVGSSDSWEFDVPPLAITDYVKIISNEKMYKLRTFTLKMGENAASVLSGDLAEEEVEE